MTKHLLFLVAAAGLIFANSGCTSKKADDEQQIVENADVEKIEADGLDISTDTIEPSLDAAPAESLDAAIASETAPTIDDSSLSLDTAVTTPEVATTTETLDAPVFDAAPPIVETTLDQVEPTATDTTSIATTSDAGAITETPIVDTASTQTAAVEPSVSETSYDPYASTAASMPKPASGVLKKIAETTPYQTKDGGWVNTVYVARPKEKLADISIKIFGTDKSKDIKKIAENSYLKYRSVKAGDKIYYVSPNRPDDSSKTMVYFEDMGMVPETYVAKKGDNLRKVSKELLGYDNAWVEVWTSNGVESKKSLKDGDTIRYWKAQDSAMTATAPEPAITTEPSANLVDAAQAPEATAQTSPPMGDTSGALPPPPADANANLPSPPADAMAAAETRATADAMAATDPGLPPPAELAPPPPPPPPDVAAAVEAAPKVNLDEAAAEEEVDGLDSDTMMSMGALGVLVALMAFVIIRKKKQKAAQMMNSEMNA